MSTCSFLLSTGRTSTQNIADIAKRAYPECIVEHEGLEYRYNSRVVFRRPRQFTRVLGSHIELQRKLIGIEDTIDSGTPYMDVGWPVYAWIPYLAERFKGRIKFAHLVRNPFMVATSLTTQRLFSGRIGKWEKWSMIHSTDKSAKFQELAASIGGMTAFECNLFHWLELNAFMLEQHELDGFVGLFQFEDLYTGDTPKVNTLLEKLMGKADIDLERSPVDGVQRKLRVKIEKANPRLVDEVMKTAVQLGYSEDDLIQSYDVDFLNERYKEKRL